MISSASVPAGGLPAGADREMPISRTFCDAARNHQVEGFRFCASDGVAGWQQLRTAAVRLFDMGLSVS
jgi:hypothetical protein